MLRTSASFFIVPLLLSCATSDLAPARPEVARLQGVEPQIGTASTASVGQNIFESFNYTVTKQADDFRVEKAINVSVGPGMHVNVNPETSLYKATATKYCVDNYGKDCLYDENGDGMVERASSQPGMIEFKKDLPEPIRYALAAGEITIMDAGGFKYQLIYQGRDGHTLRVRYMEFTDNLARPAFTQDLTYPISKENTSEIVFKNVKIEVSKVSDTSINYTVLSGTF